MKKIMVIVCAVALACVTHAASVGWSLAGLTENKGDAYSFFVIGQNGVESVSQITELLTAGSDVSKFTLGGGNVNNSGVASKAAASSGISLPAGTKYESFFVLFDSETAKDAGNYVAITSEQATGLIQTPSATAGSITFSGLNQSKFVNDPGNWSKVGGSGVPEPTSGLLLVLGCAALALRRKQK